MTALIYGPLLLFTVAYAGMVLWLWRGLYRLKGAGPAADPPVSVIVSARNEEKVLPDLLNALLSQDYPPERYQVLIVDDASEDGTLDILREYAKKARGRLRIVEAKNRAQAASPKRNALKCGIESASGDILLFTDADCIPPRGWIRGMTALFSRGVGMVIGYSPIEIPPVRGLGGHLLALESLSLAAVAAGSTGQGHPATCTGRNMAYRRRLYHDIGGFSQIHNVRSGDDDLVLMRVRSLTRWRVVYAYDADLAVPTQRPRDLTSFIHQRLRHASKGFLYEKHRIAILSLVYLYNLLLIAALAGSAAAIYGAVPWLCLAAKSAAEALLLGTFAARMRRRRYLASLLPALFIHPVYVVLFGALGNVIKYRWKSDL